MFLNRISRQNPSLSLISSHLFSSSSTTIPPSSKLNNHYNFISPHTLSPTPQQNPNPNFDEDPNPNPNKKQRKKPLYKPPSSFDNVKKVHSKLLFDFQYSYTETNPKVRPIGLREPKYSPFGPGRVDREWTGVCAPVVDRTVTSVDGNEEEEKLEETRQRVRKAVLGEPLTEEERKFLVDNHQRGKTKRQVNLGKFRH
ncbi:hypothetical protein GIB67_026160 [Kingdonia uniflora]|uniref:Uncharacterized protein n=1 Tax=Kingdonia uniflora TaxID=39325 RepID=A0A7J7M3D9_9MAGN|nr:hypothetical protein GIB67_026160 [Kingdonia uniflora]